jgi:hypothetical protein
VHAIRRRGTVRAVVIDHVVLLVQDAADSADDLRDRYGLGSERGPYLPFAGTRGYNVPLKPPSYAEILAMEDRMAAGSSESGRRALACEAAGGGLLASSVLVDGLDAVSAPRVIATIVLCVAPVAGLVYRLFELRSLLWDEPEGGVNGGSNCASARGRSPFLARSRLPRASL